MASTPMIPATSSKAVIGGTLIDSAVTSAHLCISESKVRKGNKVLHDAVKGTAQRVAAQVKVTARHSVQRPRQLEPGIEESPLHRGFQVGSRCNC